MVQQLLHSLYQNSAFCPPEGSWSVGCHKHLRTRDVEPATTTFHSWSSIINTVQGVSLPPSLHCSLLGCVAATLIALLIARVCCCHPHSIMYITRVCRCHPHSIITRVCRCHPYCSTQFWVCRCHPYCMHFMGCVAATLVLPQGAPNNL